MGTQSRLTHLCETAKLSKAQKRTILSVFFGGAEGGRTPDLLIANEALSQLSYGPAKSSGEKEAPRVRGCRI
jgi:hypothetical protein